MQPSNACAALLQLHLSSRMMDRCDIQSWQIYSRSFRAGSKMVCWHDSLRIWAVWESARCTNCADKESDRLSGTSWRRHDTSQTISSCSQRVMIHDLDQTEADVSRPEPWQQFLRSRIAKQAKRKRLKKGRSGKPRTQHRRLGHGGHGIAREIIRTFPLESRIDLQVRRLWKTHSLIHCIDSTEVGCPEVLPLNLILPSWMESLR